MALRKTFFNLKIGKIVAVGLCALLLLAAGIGYAVKRNADAHYFDRYRPDQACDLTVRETKTVNDTSTFFDATTARHYQRVAFDFTNDDGERVPGVLGLPLEVKGRLPLLVLVHGIGMNKGFADDLATPATDAGFAVACCDQLMEGDRPVNTGNLQRILAFRQRPAKTVSETRRLLDCLTTRDDIDPERIYLVGGSLGAMIGCTTFALDHRFRAAALFMGGGDVSLLLDAPYLNKLMVLAKGSIPLLPIGIGKPFLAAMFEPADPLHYAAQTAGRPILFLNGSEDTLVVPKSAELLYNAAGEPKEIRWYPVEHAITRSSDNPMIVKMIGDAMDWVVKQDEMLRNQVHIAAK
jgi:dienelactone hydrolase